MEPQVSGGGDDGFLGRWSRRKLEALRPDPAREEEPGPAQDPVAAPDAAAPDASEQAGTAQEPEVDEAYIAALPAVDEIGLHTDLKPFLRRGVPEALKNAALRRMWSVNPLIRDHADVAVDYHWDWNAPGGVPGGGGTLRPDRVAEMVRNLVSGGKRAEEPPEAPADAQVAGMQAGTAPADKAAAPAPSGVEEAPRDEQDLASPNVPPQDAAPPQPVLPPPAQPDATEFDRADRSETRLTPLRRRHGGALPS
jgi:hypothetical protein